MVNRIRWIDCMKAVAIIAVVINHAFLLTYSSIRLAYITFFSVTVFLMASGYTQHISNSTKDLKKMIKVTIKRVASILLPYITACVVYSIYYSVTLTKGINFQYIMTRFTSGVLNFELEGTFYFVFIYVLMSFLSPFLSKFITLTDKLMASKAIIIQIFVSILLLLFGLKVIVETIPVQPHYYLLGATYPFIMFVGMILSKYKIESIIKGKLAIVCTLIGTAVFGYYIYDIIEYMNSSGGGVQLMTISYINPPGILIIFYSTTVFILGANIFSSIERMDNKISKYFVVSLSEVGKVTLMIYLYHFLVRRIILDFVWQPPFNIVQRVIFLLSMFFIPLLFAAIINCIKDKIKVHRVNMKGGV